jgi:antitoxin component YwqK of YwqJK toxin-antitoxin module
MLVVLFITASLFSCDQKQPENPKKDARIEFSIPNTNEEVLMKHPDGSHRISRYLDIASGEKVAEVEFHLNGQPKIHKHFEHEILEGESWCYYEDGKPWSLNSFKNDKYHGPYKTWHENGQLHITGQYIDGLEDGEWFTYYENGQINTRGIYKAGKKVGVWSSYNLEGTMKREQDFDKPSTSESSAAK